MTMTKVLNLVIVLLAVALVLVIWYPQYKENQPVRLRILCDSSVLSTPVLVVIEESLFIENRFLPQVVFYSDPDSALARLFAGEFEIGVFPWSSIFKRIANNAETLKVIMAEAARPTMPIDALVRRSSNKPLIPTTTIPTGRVLDSLLRLRRIPTLSAFRGQAMGYPPQLRDYVTLLLAGAGMSETAFRLVEAPMTALPEMVDNGTVTVAWLLERHVSRMLDYDVSLNYDSLSGALTRYIASPFPLAAVGINPRFFNALSRTQRHRLSAALGAAGALIETRQTRVKQIVASHFPSRFDIREAENARRILMEQSTALESAYKAYASKVDTKLPAVRSLAEQCSSAFVLMQNLHTAFETTESPNSKLRLSFALVEAGQSLGELIGRFGRLADTTAPDTALASSGRALATTADRWIGSNVRLPAVLRLREIDTADVKALATRLLARGIIGDTVRISPILVGQSQIAR